MPNVPNQQPQKPTEHACIHSPQAKIPPAPSPNFFHKTFPPLTTFHQSNHFNNFLNDFSNSKRLTATQCLEHKWLTDLQLDNSLSKTKLKRYVIKKRWIKAVNTIIALKRMGAKLDLDNTEGL